MEDCRLVGGQHQDLFESALPPQTEVDVIVPNRRGAAAIGERAAPRLEVQRRAVAERAVQVEERSAKIRNQLAAHPRSAQSACHTRSLRSRSRTHRKSTNDPA